jgi:transcriptional regulator with GAF, ATPase, and Fis domain
VSENKGSGRTSQFTAEQIISVLRFCDGNLRESAKILNTSHQNLSQLIRAWGIDKSLYHPVSKKIADKRRPSLLTKADVEGALATGGDQARAARLLGVSQGFVSKLVKKFGIVY